MLTRHRQHQTGNAQFTRLRDFGALQPSHPTYDPQQFPAGLGVHNQPVLAQGERNLGTKALKVLWQKINGKWFKLTLRVICMLALVFLLRNSLSWSILLAGLAQARPAMLLVAAVVGGGGVIVSTYQWRGLLRSEHIALDLADLVKLYLVGITFNHLLPTGMGGDTVKALYVGRQTHNGAGAASAGLMCRVTGFLGMLLIILPVFAFWHDMLALDLLSWLITFCALGMIALGGTIILVLLLPRIAGGGLLRYPLLLPIVRVGAVLRMSIAKPRAIVAAIAYGCVFWLLAILNCYSYAVAVGLNLPLYDFCIIVPLVSLVAALPFSINGFGLREHALIYAFSAIHVSASISLLIALFLDVQAFCLALLGAWLYFSMDFKPGSLIKKTTLAENGLSAESAARDIAEVGKGIF